jgi:hypothetical protein
MQAIVPKLILSLWTFIPMQQFALAKGDQFSLSVAIFRTRISKVATPLTGVGSTRFSKDRDSLALLAD